jgi:hypothetical protein
VTGATLVYASARALFLFPPGQIVYHYKGRHHFPRYVDDPEASARVGYPAVKSDGTMEKGWTRCGRLTEEEKPSHRHPNETYRDSHMRAIRLDHAVLLGRLCVECGRRGPRP